MSPRRPHIDVVAASLRAGDGVSFDARQCHAALCRLGVESHLFCDYGQSAPEARKWAQHYRLLAEHPAPDAVLYAYSTFSPLTSFLRREQFPLILRYQNITPPDYFEPYAPDLADKLSKAREELVDLCAWVDAAICPSEFNASELRSYGVRQLHVVPNFCRLRENQDAAPPTSHLRILYVGRIVPNKCQHELVQVATSLCDSPGRRVELVLAGSTTDCPTYAALVRSLARGSSAHVNLTGDFAEEVDVFTGAHFYVSMSEHEGFGMPLVEAMSAGIPVVAYATAAVPEVVSDGGILFDKKDVVFVAALIETIAGDAERWHQLSKAAIQRAGQFHHDRIRGQLAAALRSLGFEVTNDD